MAEELLREEARDKAVEGNMPLIKFENVYKIYTIGENEIHAVDGVSFEIEKGEFVSIIGQSGSGKSTCMNIIGCLDVPSSGKYYLNNQDVGTLSEDEQADIRNKMLGFIFQQYNLLPKLTVIENVKLPLLYRGLSEEEQERRAHEALAKVDLDSKCRNRPNQLSGGQQQRVSIARALAGNPALILADEPTGALDTKTGREVMDFLTRLNSQGNTVVIVTHDNIIASQTHRVIRLLDGKITYDGEPMGDAQIRKTVES